MFSIIHLVRNFSPVGGMEKYVTHLVTAQAKKGYQVTVLCNSSDFAPQNTGIKVICFNSLEIKPRWLTALLFGFRCKKWLRNAMISDKSLVHSHERTWFHDISTFHGQVYKASDRIRIWQRFSLRNRINHHLEFLQLLCSTNQAVVPVSDLIHGQLLEQYPSARKILLPAINPGINGELAATTPRTQKSSRPVIGFIGKEWKRKGLTRAVRIFEHYLSQYGDAELVVAGCSESDIAHLFKDSVGEKTTILGWVNHPSRVVKTFDVLLHPARSEPYGMVVAEAMAQKVPVVVSDRCGIQSDVTAGRGRVLPLERDLQTWVDALKHVIETGFSGTAFDRTWEQVAEEYGMVYRDVLVNRMLGTKDSMKTSSMNLHYESSSNRQS